MAERAGYDQPGDGYTGKQATFGVEAPPPYQPGVPAPQQGYVQQPYPAQQPYAYNTNTTVVVNQPQTGALIIQPRHQDHMLGSILACLCCFWPTGLCAIYYAYEANNLANAGDYEGARRMSDNARRLMISSVVVGIIVIIVVVILQVFLATASASTDTNGY